MIFQKDGLFVRYSDRMEDGLFRVFNKWAPQTYFNRLPVFSVLLQYFIPFLPRM